MVIDKKLNLDKKLEYFEDGGLAFAQNIITSDDGLTIQNEPAIQNFINLNDFEIVGFIACNEEFVLFSSKSAIVKIDKKGNSKYYDTNWKYQGGKVFGTFTYNVANELIIAISERDLPNGVNCPLKVINLDREEGYTPGITDDIYTLTPTIPKANMTEIEYVLGNRIKKGKYNFFIKYYFGDNFETAWFPIGVPVFAYDNISSDQSKLVDKETIQAIDELSDIGLPNKMYNYNIIYEDFYNDDSDYTNNNIKLTFEINDTLTYTHYRIGYIVNTNSGAEGRQTSKQLIDESVEEYKVLISDYSEPISIDELTINHFNIYNVNTMCNYKDRLYLANYKEENRNKDNLDIDTSGIRISYVNDNDDIPSVSETNRSNNYSQLKNQWKSKPGRCAIYNFFIHYVYPNGNYTDGIHIGDVSDSSNYVTNSKGDVLFKTPQYSAFNVDKLIFTGIKMYPQFVGYFISYEKPEYIQIGEGFLVATDLDRSAAPDSDIFRSMDNITSWNWKFYYPEFNIVGGKSNVNEIIHTGTHELFANSRVDVSNNSRGREATGYILTENDFIGSYNSYDVKLSTIKSPNGYENIGKEGYLRIDFNTSVNINQSSNFKTYTAVNNTSDLYLSDTKKLVSLGYIKYQNYENSTKTYSYGYEDVPYNYDFYRCFSSVVFFNRSGVIINQTESNHINATSGEEFYPAEKPSSPFYPHIGIIKYWHETHYPLFLKELNQSPETVFYSYYKYSENTTDGGVSRAIENNPDDTAPDEDGGGGGGGGSTAATYKDASQHQRKSLIINPQYANDLYKLDPVYYDYTGKILVNYDKKLISNQLETYDKTIRRSDVIQSESIVNSWKYFRPENYKIITEDKGSITNIVGIGNYLFAHCEHSLFLFDITDSLQALDKNVQLLQPDSFEVAYKEVFTASKGYGGLQDHVSWICDEFGYIFFDKSAKKIYRFDGGQLKDMTNNIENLLKSNMPDYIYMGNDRQNNRILFNFINKPNQFQTNSYILSCSTITNEWLSVHSYGFNKGFINLKDCIYPIITSSKDSVTVLEYSKTAYNDYTLVYESSLFKNGFESFVDIVFTNNLYNKIKVLDFITYIIDKEPGDVFEDLKIAIYTNCCYSGIIDISQERKKVSEYKKPYYDFERWNFNWFRNRIDKIENGDIVNRINGKINTLDEKVQRGYDNALISGKYAVIRFIFKNTTKQVNIKDIQAYFKP